MSYARLERAYRATSFWVKLPSGRARIRHGEVQPALDRHLPRGRPRWAHITAFNPGSRPLSAEENRRRQAALRATASALGYRVFPGWGQADQGDWPVERAIWIAGIDPTTANLLGRVFGQAAIVVGRRGEAARVVRVR